MHMHTHSSSVESVHTSIRTSPNAVQIDAFDGIDDVHLCAPGSKNTASRLATTRIASSTAACVTHALDRVSRVFEASKVVAKAS